MMLVSALYPNTPGSRFDAAYYLGPHRRLAHRMLDPQGLIALRATTGKAALDGATPPYWAISELHFPDRATFDTAMAACGAEIFADAANYTDVTPILQVSTLAGSID